MTSPFNQARYEQLLEGLEAIEISREHLMDDNGYFRLDAEFYKKAYEKVIMLVKSFGAKQLKEISPTIIHPTEIKREYEEEGGTWFFRTQNLRPLSIEKNNDVFVSTSDAEKLNKNIIRNGDVLVTRTGANFGDCAYFNLDESPIASSHVLIIRNRSLSQPFLSVFLNSRYGRLQINKGAYGGVQPEVSPYYLRNIWIPEFTRELIHEIDGNISKARVKKEQSQELAAQAEATLLDELGLANWTPPEPLSYTRSAKEVFTAERLDAEHFKPKYDDLISRLASNSQEVVSLGSIVQPIRNGFDFREYEESGTPYIRVGDIHHGRIDIVEAKRIRLNFSSIKKNIKLMHGDVLFTRKGSYGNAAAVRGDEDGAVISSEIMLLRLNGKGRKVMPQFLATYLNSVAGALQSEKWAHGVAFYSISQADLSRFIIPIPEWTVQQEVAKRLELSETVRRDAIVLLDKAKSAVEIAIEDGEVAAIEYLKGDR